MTKLVQAVFEWTDNDLRKAMQGGGDGGIVQRIQATSNTRSDQGGEQGQAGSGRSGARQKAQPDEEAREPAPVKKGILSKILDAEI
jgi:hypothetical protein